MRIAILGYREWAHELAETVARARTESVLWVDRFPAEADVVFAVGWSEMISPEDYNRIPTFVLHPSPLPRYRGGSPIQHQILAGEAVSAVTIFKLTDEYPEVDSGPIAWQMPYSLEGPLAEILQRIATVGARGVIDVIRAMEDGSLALMPQRLSPGNLHAFKRRTPAESEITPAELREGDGRWLADKVRCLADPYPNAFIRTADGGRLLIREAVYEPPEATVSARMEEGDTWVDGRPVQRWYCGHCSAFLGHHQTNTCPNCQTWFAVKS